jgi:hypothetical protein
MSETLLPKTNIAESDFIDLTNIKTHAFVEDKENPNTRRKIIKCFSAIIITIYSLLHDIFNISLVFIQ